MGLALSVVGGLFYNLPLFCRGLHIVSRVSLSASPRFALLRLLLPYICHLRMRRRSTLKKSCRLPVFQRVLFPLLVALRNIREKMFISSLTPSFCFLPLQCLYFPAFIPLEKVACVVHHFSFFLPLYHGGALCLSMLPPSCSGVLFTVLAAFHIKNQQKTC